MLTQRNQNGKLHVPAISEMKLFNSSRTGRIIKFEPENITRKKQNINRVLGLFLLLSSIFGMNGLIDFAINNRQQIIYIIHAHLGV